MIKGKQQVIEGIGQRVLGKWAVMSELDVMEVDVEGRVRRTQVERWEDLTRSNR